MKSILFTAAMIIVAAIYLPAHLERAGAPSEENIAVSKTGKGPRKAVIWRSRDGHYKFRANMNGMSVKVLVDTGATSVAINRSTAKRIGIQLKDRDFRHTAVTANGNASFARANIREIRYDGIVVRNVSAAVLHDHALSNTLLGMSFLNKLKKFEFTGKQLTLVQ